MALEPVAGVVPQVFKGKVLAPVGGDGVRLDVKRFGEGVRLELVVNVFVGGRRYWLWSSWPPSSAPKSWLVVSMDVKDI